MPDLGDTLSKQVGPLPVGGWVLAIAGGLGVAYFINRDAPEPNPGTFDPGSDAGLGFTSRGGAGSDLPGSNPDAFRPAEPAEGDDEGDEPSTNMGWSLLAIRTGIGMGLGPLRVNAAVSKYLTGQELTPAEGKVINLLLTELGPPPNPVPTPRIKRPPSGGASGGGSSTPEPQPEPDDEQPAQPPRSPAPRPEGSSLRRQIRAIFDKYGLSVKSSRLDRLVREVQNGRTLASIDAGLRPHAKTGGGPDTGARTYTIVSGDTLWAIAQRFYGSGSQWTKLWSANSDTLRSGNPHLIYPGERIVVP